MSKKNLKIAGTILAIFAFADLFLPWIYAYHNGDCISCDFTTSGVKLVELSVWGSVIVIVPILLAGVMYSRLSEKGKTLLLFALYILGSVGFYFAVSDGTVWLREVSTEYVELKRFAIWYPIFLFTSLLMFYLHCNKIDDIEKTESFVGELYVCSRQYSFMKLNEGEKTKNFGGCISFFTKDGFFAALGHKEKGDNIEILDGEENVGYIMNSKAFGSYGAFYEDYAIPDAKKMKISAFGSIERGDAELWLAGEKGLTKKKVKIHPEAAGRIICNAGVLSDNNICGAVIVQNGKIAAVVSEYDEENYRFICVSAERVAIPLRCLSLEYEMR